MKDTLLRVGGVRALVPFGKSKLYSLVSEGKFPAPKKIEGCVFWRQSEVEAWVARHFPAGSPGEADA